MKIVNCKLKIILTLVIAFLFLPVLASASVRLQMPPNYLSSNNGLVGYWTMDGNKVNWATGAVTDSSGQGNTGTVVGMATSSGVAIGKIGQALNFDGVNDYVNVTGISNLNTGRITASAWVYWTGDTDRDVILQMMNPLDDLWFNVNTTAGSNTFDVYFRDLASPGYHSSITTVPLNKWTLLTATWDGSNINLYINGVLDKQVGTSGNVNMNTSSWKIGDREDGSGYFFHGLIDEVRVYNRALTPSEVEGLYRSGAAKVTQGPSNLNLVGYWPMNENTGTIAGDFSGNGNRGILTNGPTWVDGKRGKALNFDGVDDYINAGSAATVDNIWASGGTASAWIYARSYGENSRGRIFDKASSNNPDSGWIVFIANGGSQQSIVFDLDWSVDVGGAGIWCLATTTQPYPTMNKWMHIAVTYSSSASSNDPTFYVNGVQAPISAYTGCNNNGTGAYQTDAAQNLLIGTSASGDRSFDGLIDEARLYKRVLSAAEIQALYQADYAKVNAPQNNQITNGLVGMWSFNGPDLTTTTAFDRSGQGNNGTLTNGPIPAIGKIGQALSFDGGDDYVNVGTSLDQNGEVSISAWIKTDTVVEGIQEIVANSDNTGTAIDYLLEINRTAGRLTLLRSSLAVSVTNNTNLSVGVWYHVVGVLSGSSGNWTATLYLNGVSDGSAADANNPNGTNQTTSIGGLGASGALLFDGLIDDVRVYNRALSATEVKQLYSLGK